MTDFTFLLGVSVLARVPCPLLVGTLGGRAAARPAPFFVLSALTAMRRYPGRESQRSSRPVFPVVWAGSIGESLRVSQGWAVRSTAGM